MLLILVLNYFRSLDIIQWLVVVWVSVVHDSHMKGTITWEHPSRVLNHQPKPSTSKRWLFGWNPKRCATKGVKNATQTLYPSAKQYLELGPSLTFFECFCDLRSQVYRIDHYLAKNMVPWLPSIQTSSDFAGGDMYLYHPQSFWIHSTSPGPTSIHVPSACNEVLNILALRFANRELGRLFHAPWPGFRTRNFSQRVTDLTFKPNRLVD